MLPVQWARGPTELSTGLQIQSGQARSRREMPGLLQYKPTLLKRGWAFPL